MLFTRPATTSQINLSLLLLRIAFGGTMAAYGWQKVFVYGLGGVSTSFAGMGIPMPGVTGPFIALLELVGGVALVLGLLTRLFAAGIAIDMLVAALVVHLPNGFFPPKGAALVLLLCAATSVLALAGAGEYSIDHALASKDHS